jgi:hypothetical protein
LLYLNADTFVDEGGTQLTEELRKALAVQLPIVMAHESDPDRGGCEFSRFFCTTPEDLINDGLYKTLAVSLYAGEKHRAVGRALIAKAMGAVAVKRSSTESKFWKSSSQDSVEHLTKPQREARMLPVRL